jgi:mono/diheme cytochrome c family protein
MKRWILFALTALALAAVVVIVGFTQTKLDALQEPGHLEGIPSAPTNLRASVEEGDKLYATECSMCHGPDGHTPTDCGRWMYPRVSDLTSPEVQQYSDRELFWIVKNGIRLSGMPAFGRVESDEHIWNLVHYVRTFRGSAHPESGGAAD